MQAAQDSFSISRRPLDIEDYISIARRNKSWILAPAFLGLVVAVVVAYMWPDTYVSTATIRVTPQNIPEKYVPTNVNVELSARIQQMAQTLLSRAVMTNIIQSYGLYPREQRTMPMEDVIEKMQNAISIGGVSALRLGGRQNVPAFRVQFQYANRYVAQKVVQDVVTRLIDENIRLRSNQSVLTTEFLQEQWLSVKKDLEAMDAKIAEFRMRNHGNLPDQAQANITHLTALQGRISSLDATTSRINQEKMMLEARLTSLKDRQKALAAGITMAGGPGGTAAGPLNTRLAEYDRAIERAELQIQNMRQRWTDAHPDMKAAAIHLKSLRAARDKEAAAWEKRLKEAAAGTQTAEAKKKAASVYVSPETAREMRELQTTIEQTEVAIQAKDLDLQNVVREQDNTKRLIETVQSRIQASPAGEQEYLTLMRERATIAARYDDLDRKKQSSEIATEVEKRKQGETLEQLDAASLPSRPTYPNRPMIIGAGSFMGLIAGLALAAVREMRDTSLKNLKDVRAYTQLAIMGSVPLLENDIVVRRRRRVLWLAWTTALLIGCGIMSGAMYYYYNVSRS
jgi:polysaccharide chain length determinant protein (PEP-CTERM system associated)